jgi:hypothetical protein
LKLGEEKEKGKEKKKKDNKEGKRKGPHVEKKRCREEET